nr:MAG TPA: hypothetical protein [Caudoviricetes sp.]
MALNLNSKGQIMAHLTIFFFLKKENRLGGGC